MQKMNWKWLARSHNFKLKTCLYGPALPLAPPRPLHGGRRHGALLHQVVLLTIAVPLAAHAAESAADKASFAVVTVFSRLRRSHTCNDLSLSVSSPYLCFHLWVLLLGEARVPHEDHVHVAVALAHFLIIHVTLSESLSS